MSEVNIYHSSTHLSLSVLQLSFLLLHPLNEHLPHLVLSLLQLHQELLPLGLIRLLQTATNRQVQAKASKELSRPWGQENRVGRSPDWFALWSCVFESHFLQFAAPVQLIVASVSLLSQVLHVYADQHLPQFHKVAVVFIFH